MANIDIVHMFAAFCPTLRQVIPEYLRVRNISRCLVAKFAMIVVNLFLLGAKLLSRFFEDSFVGYFLIHSNLKLQLQANMKSFVELQSRNPSRNKAFWEKNMKKTLPEMNVEYLSGPV